MYDILDTIFSRKKLDVATLTYNVHFTCSSLARLTLGIGSRQPSATSASTGL